MHGSPSFIPSRVQNVLSIIKSLKRVSQDCWSATAFMRVFLVFLLTSTFVLGSWTAVTPRAHAAALRSTAALATHSQHTSASPNTSLVSSGMNSSGAGSVDAIGEAGFYTYVSKTVNDHLTVRVNVGNGNLVVHASDLHIQGTKLDLSIERFYNVQSSSTRLTDLSTHWNLSTGADVYLQFNGDGSITFFGPSGQSALFNPNGSSGFLDPTGLNATLTKPGNYQLTCHKSGESFLFDSSGRLTTDKEKNGEQISFAYNGSTHQLTSITDMQGRVTTLSYDGSGRLSTITDPSGQWSHTAMMAVAISPLRPILPDRSPRIPMRPAARH